MLIPATFSSNLEIIQLQHEESATKSYVSGKLLLFCTVSAEGIDICITDRYLFSQQNACN